VTSTGLYAGRCHIDRWLIDGWLWVVSRASPA
jgi:hypothetical protein